MASDAAFTQIAGAFSHNKGDTMIFIHAVLAALATFFALTMAMIGFSDTRPDTFGIPVAAWLGLNLTFLIQGIFLFHYFVRLVNPPKLRPRPDEILVSRLKWERLLDKTEQFDRFIQARQAINRDKVRRKTAEVETLMRPTRHAARTTRSERAPEYNHTVAAILSDSSPRPSGFGGDASASSSASDFGSSATDSSDGGGM